MLTLSCASQEKSKTADGSPRIGPGCVCFHFTNKIYNPLTLLTPHSHTSTLTGGRGVVVQLQEYVSVLQQQEGKYEGTKINKSAKTSQMFRVGAGTRRDGWLLPEMSRTRRPPLHSSKREGGDRDRETQTESETRWLCVCVCDSVCMQTNEMKRAF